MLDIEIEKRSRKIAVTSISLDDSEHAHVDLDGCALEAADPVECGYCSGKNDDAAAHSARSRNRSQMPSGAVESGLLSYTRDMPHEVIVGSGPRLMSKDLLADVSRLGQTPHRRHSPK